MRPLARNVEPDQVRCLAVELWWPKGEAVNFAALLIDVIQEADLSLAYVQHQTRIRTERILGIRDGAGNFSSFWIVFNAVPSRVKAAYLRRLIEDGIFSSIQELLLQPKLEGCASERADIYINTGLLRCWLYRQFGVCSHADECRRLGAELMPFGCIRVDGHTYRIPEGAWNRSPAPHRSLPSQSLWLTGDRLHPEQSKADIRYRQLDFSLINATIQALRDTAMPRRHLFQAAIANGAGSAIERQWPGFRSSGALRIRTWAALMDSLPLAGQISFVLHAVCNYGLQDAFLVASPLYHCCEDSRKQMVGISKNSC